MATISVVAGLSYSCKADHRDATAKKSQWTVPVAAELETFRVAVTRGWVEGDLGWGLHLEQGEARYLGTSRRDPGPEIPLFVALFELAPTCHGYPTDPRDGKRHKPPTQVRRAWLDGKHVRRAVLRKMGRGQRCSL